MNPSTPAAARKMVIRIAVAHFDPQRANEVAAMLRESKALIWPKQQQLPGYVDGCVGLDRRAGTVVWATFWDTVEHADALGALPEMLAGGERLQAQGVTFDPASSLEIL